MKKTTLRPAVGSPAPGKYLAPEEVRPKQWRAIWEATAPQARKTKQRERTKP